MRPGFSMPYMMVPHAVAPSGMGASISSMYCEMLTHSCVRSSRLSDSLRLRRSVIADEYKQAIVTANATTDATTGTVDHNPRKATYTRLATSHSAITCVSTLYPE